MRAIQGAKARSFRHWICPALSCAAARIFLGLLSIVLIGGFSPLAAQSGPCPPPNLASVAEASGVAQKIPASQMMPQTKTAMQTRFAKIHTEATALQNGTHRLCAEKRGFDREIAQDNQKTSSWNQTKLRIEAEIDRYTQQCVGRMLYDAELTSCRSWRARLDAEQQQAIREKQQLATAQAALKQKISSWDTRWRQAAERTDQLAKQFVVDASKAEVDFVLKKIDQIIAADANSRRRPQQ